MAFIKINDTLKKRGGREVRFIPRFADGARVKVLTDNCSHCIKLCDNAAEAVRRLGMSNNDIEIINNLGIIVKAGVTALPALIVDGRLVSSGKVLTVDEAAALIQTCRAKE